MIKPGQVFDRDFEWRHLAAFVERRSDRPQLAVVSGRRRMGKTFLLEALAREAGGFYFGATEATETESLLLFAEALTEYVGAPTPLRFASWDEAIVHLFSVGAERPGPIVIDEFPYLSKVAPALPSILQREIDRGVSRRNPIRLLLCGSAMSVMGRLLAGTAPLRGRANLELVVRPFDYQMAAGFWGADDPALAVRLHAVVGGTPAYRRFVNDDAPTDLADFDDWVLRTVLDPGTPLFREARYLLDEETEARDPGLFHSVLSAVAHGRSSRGGIADYIGRKSTDIGHPLTVLEDCGLLRRDPDLFHSGKSHYRIAEPLITFYQVVMRPQWGLLESGRAALVWNAAKARFASQVAGPHFEELCRRFAVTDQATELWGDLPAEVGSGVLTDHKMRAKLELDVVVLAQADPGERRRVLSIGEAKWGKTMGPSDVARLARARELLTERGYDTTDTRLVCYSGASFTGDLADSPETPILLGIADLYPSASRP
ncbi:AAA family ATPase [Actinocorallia populi]|uniref:AAA family ATPase n=1 Tax=Actinocorallia populi TaxID=2079200 RepID=UPI000D088660|nr:ATP-binding protein [Actinocorallia populi]